MFISANNKLVDRLIFKIPRSHTTRYIQCAGLLCKSDQLLLEAATYTSHKHNKRKSMSSEASEPAISAFQRPQTEAVEYPDAGIGLIAL